MVRNIIVAEDYGVDKMDYKKIQLPVSIQDKEIAVCLGNFDGIHKGHQKLIEKTKTKTNIRAVAATRILSVFLGSFITLLYHIKDKKIKP